MFGCRQSQGCTAQWLRREEGRSMSETQCTEQLELFEDGRQQVTMTFDGGQIVSDAGLLPIREFDKKLGILPKRRDGCPIPEQKKPSLIRRKIF